MDPATILYTFAGAAEVTAHDLAEVKDSIERVMKVIEGSGLWSRLAHCVNRLDVHVNAMKAIAKRARDASAELNGTVPMKPIRYPETEEIFPMNTSEALDLNTVLNYLLGLDGPTGPPRPDDAQAAAERLTRRSNQALMAGLRPDQVAKAWPNRTGKGGSH